MNLLDQLKVQKWLAELLEDFQREKNDLQLIKDILSNNFWQTINLWKINVEEKFGYCYHHYISSSNPYKFKKCFQ